MAGSLVQVPTVAFAATAAQEGQGDAAQRWHRFRILAGFLHVVCPLVVVSKSAGLLAIKLPTLKRNKKWAIIGYTRGF